MNYTINHIPPNTPNNRRPAYPMTPTTITIHNTGNPSSTAANERAWLTNPSNDRTASFHIVVDEKEAIECIPLNENAWAAGDGLNGPGNRTSIHIEICESGNYAQTLENAAQLVAKILIERGWGTDRLRRHWDWTKKICPRKMYDEGRWTGWTAFLNMVQYKMKPFPTIQREVGVILNGEPIGSGYLINNTSYVPVRMISEMFGAQVGWDGNVIINREMK